MDTIEQYKRDYAGIYRGAVCPDAVDAILLQYGVSDTTYRQWLTETGGGPIGSEGFDGVEELTASQAKFASEPWSISGFVLGWDGSGNPMAMQPDGKIISEDHDVGSVYVVAATFAQLLADALNS